MAYRGLRPLVFIAGPMTGLPGFNFDAFYRAEGVWKGRDYRVINPARRVRDYASYSMPSHVYEAEEDVLERLFAQQAHATRVRKSLLLSLMDAQMVAVLPDWQKSVGIRIELATAEACNIPIVDAWTTEPLPAGLITLLPLAL